MAVVPVLAALVIAAATTEDPAVDGSGGFSLISFFTTNFESVGGWSLFIGLCLFIVAGSVFEWWVPGRRHRRVEAAAAEQSKTLATTVDLLKDAQVANEITTHFFEKTVPTRGESV